jgi:rhodanese-related sulfurtransferase
MTTELPDPFWAKRFFKARTQFTTGPMELDQRLRDGAKLVLVDVREVKHYAAGHLPGALSLPKERWPSCDGLRKDVVNVLYGYSAVCHLAAAAAVEFSDKGYPVMELEGGFEEWQSHNLEVEA